MAHVVPEASPNCTLPRAVALSLDAEVEKERDRCRQEESTVGSASPTELASQPDAASPSAPVDEVKAYLWSVYQRSTTKVDGHGDFTWKDVSAAGRSGLSVEDYVIGGLDPDFRELLFAAGHAMDAAGIGWTILSGFRDDFRQDLTSGLKARVNNSFHGGSEATGGYRHGCAVDLASVDRPSDDKVWNWVDRKGREFDLFRPLRAADPAHTLPLAGWHELAAALRNQRLGISAEADPAPLGDVVTLEQYLCVRPLLPDPPPPREPRWRKLRAMEPQAGSPVRPCGMKQIPTGMALLKSQRVFASNRRSRLGPHPRIRAATSLKTTRPPRSIDLVLRKFRSRANFAKRTSKIERRASSLKKPGSRVRLEDGSAGELRPPRSREQILLCGMGAPCPSTIASMPRRCPIPWSWGWVPPTLVRAKPSDIGPLQYAAARRCADG
jgi:hypothetical protein